MNANKHENDLKRYIQFWETLKPDNVDRLSTIVTPDVVFSDPFNTTESRQELREVLLKMFDDVDQPQFRVSGFSWARTVDPFPEHVNAIAYLKWEFSFAYKDQEEFNTVTGMSEVHIQKDGLIMAHYDHWDASTQFYMDLPVIGWLIKQIKKRI